MPIQDVKVVVIANGQALTAGGFTGAWIDLVSLALKRNIKAVLALSIGTTAGTSTITMQSATDTSGTGAVTAASFTATNTNATEVKHAVLAANHRYVRLLNTQSATSDMKATVIVAGLGVYAP